MYPLDAANVELDLQRYAALLEMADVVSRHQRAVDLFQDLTPRLQAVIPFDLINFSLHDPARNLMKMYLSDCSAWPASAQEVTPEDSVAGWVWKNQTTLSIPDLDREQRFEPRLRVLRDLGVHSYCVLPLTSAHLKLGALGFGSRHTHAFSERDVLFLQRVAELVALSTDNTLSQEALAEERQRAHALLEFETILAASLDLKQL